MSYDVKCRDLALDWLDADGTQPTPRRVDSLAQAIQDAIETWEADQQAEAIAASGADWDRQLHEAEGK